MRDAEIPSERSEPPSRRRRWSRLMLGVLLFYVLAAYLAIPFAWEQYAKRHPSLDDSPRVTRTGDGHPGDPINVALIGSEADVCRIMAAAHWHPASPLGMESDLRIAIDVVLSRPDEEAPVSNLFLFGRKEDLAFEQPVGHSPRQRHHVRFWKAPQEGDRRDLWVGAASYDARTGLSHTTGQITHHIAADVDAERDYLFAGLRQTGQLSDTDVIEDFHQVHEGRNGGGDLWRTDGELYVGTIRPPES